MSKVISFRLSEDNPREAQALMLLEKMLKKGIGFRSTITDALLQYDDYQPRRERSENFDDLSDLIDRLGEIVEKSDTNFAEAREPVSQNTLSEKFKVSMNKVVKPGIKYRD